MILNNITILKNVFDENGNSSVSLFDPYTLIEKTNKTSRLILTHKFNNFSNYIAYNDESNLKIMGYAYNFKKLDNNIVCNINVRTDFDMNFKIAYQLTPHIKDDIIKDIFYKIYTLQ